MIKKTPGKVKYAGVIFTIFSMDCQLVNNNMAAITLCSLHLRRRKVPLHCLPPDSDQNLSDCVSVDFIFQIFSWSSYLVHLKLLAVQFK